MLSTNNNEINSLLHAIEQKNNAYVNIVLSRFINATFKEFNTLVNDMGLLPEHIIILQIDFLNELREIDFMKAYLHKTIRRDNEASPNVNYDSLAKYITEQIPWLKDVEKYIRDELKITNKRDEALVKVGKIKETVNQYQGQNKRLFIDNFNRKIDALQASLKVVPYHEVNQTAKDELIIHLDVLQRQENAYYYDFRFFARRQRLNSSLQPKINEAKAKIEEFGMVKNKPQM